MPTPTAKHIMRHAHHASCAALSSCAQFAWVVSLSAIVFVALKRAALLRVPLEAELATITTDARADRMDSSTHLGAAYEPAAGPTGGVPATSTSKVEPAPAS